MNALCSLFASLFQARKSTGSRRPSQASRDHSAKPSIEQLDARIVPALLNAVPQHTIYPYTAVTEVTVTFPDNKTFVGSGAMIDSFHVLTAAHMLYSYADGGFATTIKVTPDMYYLSAPFGVAYGTYDRVDSSWPAFSKANPGQISSSIHDIGLVTLNSAIGNKTGWFGFGYNNNNYFTNSYFETAGYPASYGYNGQQMYYSFGKTNGVQGYDINFNEGNISDIPGQSGSPLWNTGNNTDLRRAQRLQRQPRQPALDSPRRLPSRGVQRTAELAAVRSARPALSSIRRSAMSAWPPRVSSRRREATLK